MHTLVAIHSDIKTDVQNELDASPNFGHSLTTPLPDWSDVFDSVRKKTATNDDWFVAYGWLDNRQKSAVLAHPKVSSEWSGKILIAETRDPNQKLNEWGFEQNTT